MNGKNWGTFNRQVMINRIKLIVLYRWPSVRNIKYRIIMKGVNWQKIYNQRLLVVSDLRPGYHVRNFHCIRTRREVSVSFEREKEV